MNGFTEKIHAKKNLDSLAFEDASKSVNNLIDGQNNLKNKSYFEERTNNRYVYINNYFSLTGSSSSKHQNSYSVYLQNCGNHHQKLLHILIINHKFY